MFPPLLPPLILALPNLALWDQVAAVGGALAVPVGLAPVPLSIAAQAGCRFAHAGRPRGTVPAVVTRRAADGGAATMSRM
jgi:hypothetical protein